LVAVLCLATEPALAADEFVVLGEGLSNSYLGDIVCDARSSCLDGRYLWTIRVTRTVVGPPLPAILRFVALQHTTATAEFVRSTELFVLSRADASATQSGADAEFSLLALSPRYEGDRYCLVLDPADLGLLVRRDHITRDPQRGGFCFPRSDIVH
jgi:hypothetical protein